MLYVLIFEQHAIKMSVYRYPHDVTVLKVKDPQGYLFEKKILDSLERPYFL